MNYIFNLLDGSLLRYELLLEDSKCKMGHVGCMYVMGFVF